MTSNENDDDPSVVNTELSFEEDIAENLEEERKSKEPDFPLPDDKYKKGGYTI